MDFPRIRSTFGVTPYNPDRDTDEKRRAIFEHYQSQMGAQPLPEETLPWNKPFPPGVAMQEGFDDMLQERVVDPLAKAGYEQLGAGLAAIPSAAHSMIVPQSEFDVAGTIIPLPGVAKAMKKGKFRKIRNAMKAEAPEEVGEIIAKQAAKPDAPLNMDDYNRAINELHESPKAEVRAIDEKEMLRKADESNAREARRLEEEPIKKGIKEKYGIESEQWSTLDDEADVEFGTSDLSGKQGDVIEITDGDQTIQVLNDEYLDLMGLSGGIGLDETPFAQKMMKKKAPKAEAPKVDAPKSRDQKIADALRKQSEGPETTEDDMFKVDQRAKMKQDTAEIERLKSLSPSDPNYEKTLSEVERSQGYAPPDDEVQDRVSRIKSSMSKINQLMEELKKQQKKPTPSTPEIVEPPKGPKGDPEASLPGNPDNSRFAQIRSQLGVAPSRMDERGQSFDKIGQSDFTPYDKPAMPQFEDIQKRNYVEAQMDPVEQTITKILAMPENLELTPQKKQALADFVRFRFKDNQDMTLRANWDENLDLMRSKSLKKNEYDYSLLNDMHNMQSDAGNKAYDGLDEAFGSYQSIMGKRDPSVKTLFDTLRREQPFGRNYDTSFEQSRGLQDKMYKGRPSFEAEQEKFGKVKEAMKEAPKPNSGPGYTQGRYHITDWAGNEYPQLGTFDDSDDAFEYLQEFLMKGNKNLSDEDLEDLLQDWVITEKAKKGR